MLKYKCKRCGMSADNPKANGCVNTPCPMIPIEDKQLNLRGLIMVKYFAYTIFLYVITIITVGLYINIYGSEEILSKIFIALLSFAIPSIIIVNLWQELLNHPKQQKNNDTHILTTNKTISTEKYNQTDEPIGTLITKTINNIEHYLVDSDKTITTWTKDINNATIYNKNKHRYDVAILYPNLNKNDIRIIPVYKKTILTTTQI